MKLMVGKWIIKKDSKYTKHGLAIGCKKRKWDRAFFNKSQRNGELLNQSFIFIKD
jgi:hypothetical protein